jgi:hypothetical protein
MKVPMLQSVLESGPLPIEHHAWIAAPVVLSSYLSRALGVHYVHIQRNREFTLTLKGYNVYQWVYGRIIYGIHIQRCEIPNFPIEIPVGFTLEFPSNCAS